MTITEPIHDEQLTTAEVIADEPITTAPFVSDEELLAQNEKHMRKVAWMMKRTYELCESLVDDIVQEASIRLIALPQDRRLIPAYVRTAINNACRDALTVILRSNRREPCGLFDTDSENDEKHGTPDARESTSSDIWVDEVLSQLSPVERQVVSIYAGLFDKSIKECRRIAKLCGCTESQAKRSLESGLAKLHRLAGKGGTTWHTNF
jgi:RNA polymerase sigma factor (sigma-70 family)